MLYILNECPLTMFPEAMHVLEGLCYYIYMVPATSGVSFPLDLC